MASIRDVWTPGVEFVAGDERSILMLSMREVADLVGYCALYEFEDVTQALTGAGMARPVGLGRLDFARQVYKLARYGTGSRRLASWVRPPLGAIRLTESYDLFMPVFNHPYELFALNEVKGWRERCRFAACYIGEVWEHQLPLYLLELLKSFDHVFIGVEASTATVAAICGRPCSYLPMGVDALLFCPYPDPSPRSIGLCGIGRRSPVTHAALLDLARRTGFFYYYDTLQSKPRGKLAKQLTFRVSNPREHRLLLANLLKRSRYFIANRAWVDQPGLTRGRDEIAARFYEGAAAGAIMLGEPPESDAFRSQFGWTDAVVHMPFHSAGVADLIAELDADPERTSRIRRDNVVNALLRHDWVHRLRRVFEVAGISIPEPMLAREARLLLLADEIRLTPLETLEQPPQQLAPPRA